MRWHGNLTIRVKECNKYIISHINGRQYVLKSQSMHIYRFVYLRKWFICLVQEDNLINTLKLISWQIILKCEQTSLNNCKKTVIISSRKRLVIFSLGPQSWVGASVNIRAKGAMGGWAYEKVNPRTRGPYRQYISSEMIGQNYFSYDVVMVTWRQRKYPKPASGPYNESWRQRSKVESILQWQRGLKPSPI